jgi:flagellar motor switch protein FliN/FliY
MNSTSDEKPLDEVNAAEAAPSEPPGKGGGETGEPALSLLRDVEVELTLEIGRRRMRIADVVKLGPGRTVELEKQAGEPLELLVNGRVIGRGEAVVIGDRYGIRITEILTAEGGVR